MASRISSLIRNFLQTDGDALYLVPGEKIFIVRGSARTVVGREVLSQETFRNVVSELVPDATPEDLARRRHRMPVEEEFGAERAELQFGLSGGVPAVMVTRLKAAAGATPPVPAEPSLPAAESIAGLPAAAVGGAPSPPAPEARPAAVPGETVPVNRPAPLPRQSPPVSVSVPFPEATARAGRLAGRIRPAAAAPEPLDAILSSVVALDAAAAFLAPGVVPLVRVDRELLAAEGARVLSPEETERLLRPIVPARHAGELAAAGATCFVHVSPGFGRFRVHVCQERAGLGAAIFRIPPVVRPLEEPLRPLAAPGAGLVLVASPPGGGRSTTLAALVAHIVATRSARVVTVEEPLELPVDGRLGLVSQREAGGEGPAFAGLVAGALSERPDAVALSDVPDPETAELLAEGAAAGTLVLAAVRASTALGALAALTGRLPAERRARLRSLLAPAIRAVVVKVLCRRRDGGLVPALELLPGGPALAELVALDRLEGLRALVDGASVRGGVSLNASLLELARRGEVDPREALLRTYDPERLSELLTSAGLVPPA